MKAISSVGEVVRHLVFYVALVSAAGACARLPKVGTPATGEPIHVHVGAHKEYYAQKMKVGEVVHRDASGRTVGTSAQYQTQTRSYDVMHWYALQGETIIDDQDFFRIGGDKEAADDIAFRRKATVYSCNIGAALMYGGGALALGGLAYLGLAKPAKGSAANDIAGGVFIGGAIAAAVGIGGVVFVCGNADAEHPLDDVERAQRVAKKYNDRLAAQKAEAAAKQRAEEEARLAEEEAQRAEEERLKAEKKKAEQQKKVKGKKK